MSTATRSVNRQRSRAKVEVAHRGPDVNSFLMGSVGVLCLMGVVMVYSASMVYSTSSGKAAASGGPPWMTAVEQAGYLAVGVLAALVATRAPASFWRSGIVTVLMVGSFVAQGYLALARIIWAISGHTMPFAIKANGAFRWLGHGGASFQPSDLAKLALILWVAKTIAENRGRIQSWEVLKRILIVTGALCALVLAGNDLGTTVLLFGTTVVMLFLAGAPWRVMVVLCAGGALVVLFAMTFLGGFRMERVSAFLDPASNTDKSYQARQSKIGFASGGIFGTGPGNSRLKWGYLPEADTDFIFAVVGEELGVAGTLLVLSSYVTFMASAVVIALRSRSRFCRLVAFGIASWIGVQALINIGVALSVLPTKGITLPFVSRGGSSLVMCLIAVGVLLSVSKEPA